MVQGVLSFVLEGYPSMSYHGSTYLAITARNFLIISFLSQQMSDFSKQSMVCPTMHCWQNSILAHNLSHTH